MNYKSFIRFTSIATILGITSFAASAQAFSLGTSGIQFDQATKVNFNFVNSQGAYTSALKIVEDLGSGQFRDLGVTLFAETRQSDNGSRNDWLGTCGAGRTVQNCSTSFTFAAGIKYSFLLDSGNNGQVFSTNALNTRSRQSQQAKFFDDVTVMPTQTAQFDMGSLLRTQAGNSSVDPYSAPVLVAFDDRGASNDKDFNDFKFTMQAERNSTSVPEPASVLGLGLVAGALGVMRRRTPKQSV